MEESPSSEIKPNPAASGEKSGGAVPPAPKPKTEGAAKVPAAGGAAKPGVAKPAGAKPAAAKPAAKKEAPPQKPLVDNGDGTITDPNTGLMWKKTDAWLDCHRFYTWQNHQEYVDQINKEKFAGYDDWRIPSKAEAVSLCDKTKTKKLIDKNGTEFSIDPVFEPGCASNTWISECTDEKIIRFDFKTQVDTAYPPTEIWASMRLVRKAG